MCFNSNNRGKGFFIFMAVIAGIFGLTAVVMLLWNAVLPGLIPVTAIGFWQAMGLLALCKILFGGFRFGGPRGSSRWKNKFANMTPEEKEAFKEKMKERWGRREC
jgi:hypothetical protein